MDTLASLPVSQGRQPHSFHGHYRSEGKKPRKLFGTPGPVGDDFIPKLLDRSIAYNPEMAYVCSIIAGWSYSDGRTLIDRLEYYGLRNASVEEIGVINPAMQIVATAYFIRSECGRVGILSFRGTEPTNLINWLTDTDVTQRNFGGTGFVHQGFYDNLQAIWDEIGIALQHAANPGSARNGDNGKRRASLWRSCL